MGLLGPASGVSFDDADAVVMLVRRRLYGALDCRARADASLAGAALSGRGMASFTEHPIPSLIYVSPKIKY